MIQFRHSRGEGIRSSANSKRRRLLLTRSKSGGHRKGPISKDRRREPHWRRSCKLKARGVCNQRCNGPGSSGSTGRPIKEVKVVFGEDKSVLEIHVCMSCACGSTPTSGSNIVDVHVEAHIVRLSKVHKIVVGLRPTAINGSKRIKGWTKGRRNRFVLRCYGSMFDDGAGFYARLSGCLSMHRGRGGIRWRRISIRWCWRYRCVNRVREYLSFACCMVPISWRKSRRRVASYGDGS